uniref:desmoplakin-like n=1 Tax=Myxine glutinosa TaxID=7769 RepID=UPI00358E0A6A
MEVPTTTRMPSPALSQQIQCTSWSASANTSSLIASFENLLREADTFLQADLRRIETHHLPWHIQEAGRCLTEADMIAKMLSAKHLAPMEIERVTMLHSELQVLQGYQHTITQYEKSAQRFSSNSAKFATINGHQVSSSNKVSGSMDRMPQAVQKMQIDVNYTKYGGTLNTASSSEMRKKLCFISDMQAWIEQQEADIYDCEWPVDAVSMKKAYKQHNATHRNIADFRTKVDYANHLQASVPHQYKAELDNSLEDLKEKYNNLMAVSMDRKESLHKLEAFIRCATKELMWLNQREEEEVTYDWSDRNTNMERKSEDLMMLMKSMEQEEVEISRVQQMADNLIAEGHPAKSTVEAFIESLQTQWSWLLELVKCMQGHLKENKRYFQFFHDIEDAERLLRSQEETINRYYNTNNNTAIPELQNLLQDAMAEKEAVTSFNRTVNSLITQAKTIVQLRPRLPEHRVHDMLSLRALCKYRLDNMTIYPNDQLLLKNNRSRITWRCTAPGGADVNALSVCLQIAPPNKEALKVANTIEMMQEQNLSLCQNMIIRLRCSMMWQCLLRDIEIITSWTVSKCPSQAEFDQIVSEFESNYKEFIRLTQDTEYLSPEELSRLKKDYNACIKKRDYIIKTIATTGTTVPPNNDSEPPTSSPKPDPQYGTLNLPCLDPLEQQMMMVVKTPLQSARPLAHSEERLAQLSQIIRQCSLTGADLEAAGQENNLSITQRTCVGNMSTRLQTLQDNTDRSLRHMKVIDSAVNSFLDVEALTKAYELKLARGELVVTSAESVHAHTQLLKQWHLEMDQRGRAIRTMREQWQKAWQADEELVRAMNLHYPDVQNYGQQAQKLEQRWDAMQQHISTRLDRMNDLSKTLEEHRQHRRFLDNWYAEATGVLQRAQSLKGNNMDEVKLIISELKKLQDQLGKNERKLSDFQKSCDVISASMKDYEGLLVRYRDTIVKYHGSLPPLDVRGDFVQEQYDLRIYLQKLSQRVTEYISLVDNFNQMERRVKITVDGQQMSLLEAYNKGYITKEKYNNLTDWRNAI